MNATSIILDTEFTGLHQDTTLISLALYKDESAWFYAEFNDFDASQLSPWVEQHVISLLEFSSSSEYLSQDGQRWKIKGNRMVVKQAMAEWLSAFSLVEIWADVLAYDWVLFCELFGGAFGIPENVFYAPFDLATVFRMKGLIVPESRYERDVKRFDYAGITPDHKHHHALEDARAEKVCLDKLLGI